jgi:hypothetical protein
LPDWQNGEPVYPEVPQSVLDEQAMFWFTHDPFEQDCEPVQLFFNCAEVLFEQTDEAVPALLQVYVV